MFPRFLSSLAAGKSLAPTTRDVFLSEKFLGCRFLSLSFDVPVESEIYSEGDNDDAIHDADDPQRI
jgi:hypothetical protein